jgi:preprotein translocase subunit YajC
VDPNLVLLLVFAVVVVLLWARRVDRHRAALAKIQNALVEGDDVMMTSGLYGTVEAIEGTVVTLRTGPGQSSRWARKAVLEVVTPAEQSQSSSDTNGSDTNGSDTHTDDDAEPKGSTQS